MVPGLLEVTTPDDRANEKRIAETFQTFDFIACDGVVEKGLQRNGSAIERLCYYRLATPDKTYYYTFALASSSLIADFYSYTE